MCMHTRLTSSQNRLDNLSCMQLRPDSLPDYCWACLLDTWLAHKCLAMFALTDMDSLHCERSCLVTYQQHLPRSASAAQQICMDSYRLARCAGDVAVLTPVTEKQNKVQMAHISECLQRYASLSLVSICHSLQGGTATAEAKIATASAAWQWQWQWQSQFLIC